MVPLTVSVEHDVLFILEPPSHMEASVLCKVLETPSDDPYETSMIFSCLVDIFMSLGC